MRVTFYTITGIIAILLAFIACPNYVKHKDTGYERHSGGGIDIKSDICKDALDFSYSSGGSAIPNDQPYDLTYFEDYGTNPFISTEDRKTSTFGMDVDTASYTIARRFLLDGNMPDKDSVRVEEFINYFKQDYPEPKGNSVFSISLEGARSGFGKPNYHLLKIGIKARDASMHDRPPANMIFVVDVSGSMDREDRLEQVKKSLTMLADNLKRGDRIGLVTYGSSGQVISDLTSDHNAIIRAIGRLRPGGSTNAEEGLKLAYRMARRNCDEEKINRIILCSDGVANVGNTSADVILDQVKADAVSGITLTTIGFGMGNYNDVLLEKLANHGDGMYYYIDNAAEAEKVFGGGATQMLYVLASDAKIQVEFNDKTVDRFRLLGYENRRLSQEDFKDNSVDAGEVGAGQTVTALYEIRIKENALKNTSARIATVRVRYMDLRADEIRTEEEPVNVGMVNHKFGKASCEFRFTAAVAEFAELLKESVWSENGSFAEVRRIADNCAGNYDEREFVDLVDKTIQLSNRQGLGSVKVRGE
ncbi:MAG: von Willebrand factor type A domain-containing protein [bacterium]